MKALLALLLLFALAGCAGGERPDDSNRRPVFYGGAGAGTVLSR
jgi:hypothetical protein